MNRRVEYQQSNVSSQKGLISFLPTSHLPTSHCGKEVIWLLLILSRWGHAMFIVCPKVEMNQMLLEKSSSNYHLTQSNKTLTFLYNLPWDRAVLGPFSCVNLVATHKKLIGILLYFHFAKTHKLTSK